MTNPLNARSALNPDYNLKTDDTLTDGTLTYNQPNLANISEEDFTKDVKKGHFLEKCSDWLRGTGVLALALGLAATPFTGSLSLAFGVAVAVACFVFAAALDLAASTYPTPLVKTALLEPDLLFDLGRDPIESSLNPEADVEFFTDASLMVSLNSDDDEEPTPLATSPEHHDQLEPLNPPISPEKSPQSTVNYSPTNSRPVTPPAPSASPSTNNPVSSASPDGSSHYEYDAN